jgi:hypothetical protein
VLSGVTSPALDPEHTGDSTPATGTDFGVIGAWDGHRVGKGRVVVDATWHHFFDINLSGDRYLENDNLPVSQQQKLSGFYVLDSTNTRVPNDAYRMIQWYYRNIVYWLIPANRHQQLFWYALDEIVKRPRIKEELGALKLADVMVGFGLDHYLYFGQLAEAYLSEARGYCAKYIFPKIQYKPKIPWYEWIQDVVDVWDPVQKERDVEGKRRAQWLGAIGAGPRPELAATLSLGAALITAGVHRSLFAQRNMDERIGAALDGAYTEVLSHAVGELRKALASGAEVERAFEKVVAAPLAQR